MVGPLITAALAAALAGGGAAAGTLRPEHDRGARLADVDVDVKVGPDARARFRAHYRVVWSGPPERREWSVPVFAAVGAGAPAGEAEALARSLRILVDEAQLGCRYEAAQGPPAEPRRAGADVFLVPTGRCTFGMELLHGPKNRVTVQWDAPLTAADAGPTLVLPLGFDGAWGSEPPERVSVNVSLEGWTVDRGRGGAKGGAVSGSKVRFLYQDVPLEKIDVAVPLARAPR